eukprot:gene23274-31602_t
MAALTRGFCTKVVQPGVENITGVVQVTNLTALTPGAPTFNTKFKATLFDGNSTLVVTLASQLTHQIINNNLKENSIFQIDNYIVAEIHGKRVITVTNGHVLAQGVPTTSAENVNAPPPQASVAATYGHYPTVNNTAVQPIYGSNANIQAPFTSSVYGASNTYGGSVSTSNNTSASVYHSTDNNSNPSNAYNSNAGNAYNSTNNTVSNPAQSYGSSVYGGSAHSNSSMNPSYNAPAETNYMSSMYANKPIVRSSSDSANIVPISGINPYSQKWTIKARVTSKADIRRWSNAKGEGTLFSIDLLDNQNTEIRATFFKDACDKFFPLIEQGKVYTFSGGQLKLVQNKQYNNLKNPYEITFSIQSEIRAVTDDTDIKVQTFSFVKIATLNDVEVNTSVDVLAVVRQSGDINEIVSQKQGGKLLQKRDLVIIDDSLGEVKLTLWGEKALQYGDLENKIVAFKGVKVGDYAGRSLGMMGSSSVLVNPDIPEAHRLFKWKCQFPDGNYPIGTAMTTTGAVGGAVDALEKRKSISAIKEEGLGMNDKPDFITVKGSVNYIKHDNDCWYTACPTPGCNKKVNESMNGRFTCEKCNKDYDSCNRRFILSIQMADYTGNNWFSLFNDAAEKLLGCSAQILYELRVEGNEAAYEKVFSDALFRSVVRVKQESVNDEMRTKSTVVTMNDLDLLDECNQMIAAINKYQ